MYIRILLDNLLIHWGVGRAWLHWPSLGTDRSLQIFLIDWQAWKWYLPNFLGPVTKILDILLILFVSKWLAPASGLSIFTNSLNHYICFLLLFFHAKQVFSSIFVINKGQWQMTPSPDVVLGSQLFFIFVNKHLFIWKVTQRGKTHTHTHKHPTHWLIAQVAEWLRKAEEGRVWNSGLPWGEWDPSPWAWTCTWLLSQVH